MSRVLVVDDDPSSVALCLFALEFEGHQAVGFTEPCRAIEVARREHFDVIVAEMSLQKMNGWDFLRCLESNPNTGEPPVLFISNDTYNLLSLLSLVPRHDVYGIAKPFDVGEFVDEVQRLAKQEPAA